MKDRIKKFMDYKSISAGELATLLEVQRSNISHVLNGRNKPGASFIERLLISFPDINARWLMTGEGEMLISNTGVEAKPKTIESETKATELKEESKNAESVKNKEIMPVNSTGIDKIVVLYSDGTFVDYNKK